MKAKPLRVGVVGASAKYGWARNTHVPALLELPDYELVAVCTAHEDTARESSKFFGVSNSYHDHKVMLSDAELDVVAVSVRVPFHYRLTVDALEAGKHVYTEWPLGANLAEAKDMADLAKEKNLRTMVGLQARVSPVLLAVRELIEGGYVGEVLSSRLNLFNPGILSRTSTDLWQSDRLTGANTFTISFGHPIDALCMCLGEFRDLSAVVSTQVDRWRATDTGEEVQVDAPDNVMVVGRLWNGAAVSVHVATIPWQGSGYRFEIYGTDGTLVLDAPSHVQMSSVRLRGLTSGGKQLEILEIPDRFKWAPGSMEGGIAFNVAQMWGRFADAIYGGKTVEPDFDTAVRRHSLLETIERASGTGLRQNIPSS